MGSVWFGFLGQKPVQTGLDLFFRVWLGFFPVWVRFALFFWFQAYKIEPVGFLKF
jgi:hypothetical protein